MDTEKNFYEILELPLDPPMTDPAKVMEAIDIRKKEWDKLTTTSGNRGVVFKSYKDLIPKMKEALAKPAVLQAQATEALAAAKASVRRAVSLMSGSRGYISVADLETIVNRHKNLKEATVVALARETGVEIRMTEAKVQAAPVPEEPAPPAGIKMPKPAQLKDLDVNLPVLGEQSIYAVFKCTPTSSLEAIKTNIAAFKKRARKMPKGTAKADACNTLATLAPALFETEASKRGFDYAWANYLATRDVIKDIDYLITDNHPSITRDDYLKLVDRLRELGMRKEDAEWFVYDECCNRRKSPYPAPPAKEAQAVPRRQCPHCYALNDQEAKRCCKCGNMLVVKCPGCGKEVDSSHRVCSCGFSIGDIPIAARALDDARKAFAGKRMQEAEEQTQVALLYWPGNEEALQLQANLAAARKKVEQERLRDVLASLAPPAQGKVKALPSSLLISWSRARLGGTEISGGQLPLPSGGSAAVNYKLVRKENGMPAAVDDGRLLVTTGGSQYEDTAIEAGAVYGYALFVCVNGQTVSCGCNCGKGQILAAPKGVKAISGDKSLTVMWEPLPFAQECIIVRKQGGAPADERDGVAMKAPASVGRLTDGDLENDAHYHYLVLFTFRNAQGEAVTGPGSGCSGSPVSPPPALELEKWSVQVSGKEVSLNWERMENLTVRWYLSDEPLAPGGTIVSAQDAILSGAQEFSSISQETCKAHTPATFAGLKYVTPVVIDGKHALINEPRRVTSHPGVTRLEAQRSNGNLMLIFDWPEQCDEILILYSPKACPASPQDAAAGRTICSKIVYQRNKSFIIRGVGDGGLYISVYAKIKVGGESFYSTACQILSVGAGARQIITCELKVKRSMVLFGKKSRSLVLHSSGNVLPAIQIRGKKGSLPLSRNDGILIMETEQVGKSDMELELPPGQACPGMCLGFFLAHKTESQLYTIRQPNPDQLTID